MVARSKDCIPYYTHLQDYLVCDHCANLTVIFHKLLHMQYMTFKSCEEKVAWRQVRLNQSSRFRWRPKAREARIYR